MDYEAFRMLERHDADIQTIAAFLAKKFPKDIARNKDENQQTGKPDGGK